MATIGGKFDAAVVGAGPAGATAAIILARQDRKVVLVDQQTLPRAGESLGWLNVRVAPLLDELGVRGKALLNRPFRDVTFHNADFSKSAGPQADEIAGYLIDRTAFGNALVKAARGSGATLALGKAVTGLRLKETSAVLKLSDHTELQSRLLILASGRGSDLLDRTGFAREGHGSVIWTAQVETPLKAGVGRPKPRISVILGLDKAGSFGVCCVVRDRMSVAINWLDEPEEALPALAQLCKGSFEHEVVPVDLSSQATAAKLVRSPASAALDMDTHVGKHTLVIGDAGGFVSAASNEGIYPAMWSAQIGSEVVAAALESRHSQDELMSFDSKWRIKMADYLRAPNTDNQFLLPLVFSNQPMADRMAAAFFSGENI